MTCAPILPRIVILSLLSKTASIFYAMFDIMLPIPAWTKLHINSFIL